MYVCRYVCMYSFLLYGLIILVIMNIFDMYTRLEHGSSCKVYLYMKNGKKYCKVRNINVEVILVSLTSVFDSLIIRSGNICSVLYSKCVTGHNYTWSVDNHTYIQRHT